MNVVSESLRRLYEKLYRDLGNEIVGFLQDKEINEVMLNPDGRLWIDSSSNGLIYVNEFSPQQAFSIINGIAGIHGFIVNQVTPRLEAELPNFKAMKGERFTAQVPPVVSAPCFTIRKKSEIVYTLSDYVDSKRMTKDQEKTLKNLVSERKNILVCGGPGSGKTTITNALIIEAVKSDINQRFLVLEDLPELQCEAPNKVLMLTTSEVNMRALLRSAMRMRPDRILIGEVRGAEALDMLKAWNTGCPGGICTVHANGAEEAVQRITDLSMEAGLLVPPIQLIGHTIDAVVSVTRKNSKKGFVNEILTLGDFYESKFNFKKIG